MNRPRRGARAWARTITSRSRSACASSSRGSAPCCGDPSRSQSSRSLGYNSGRLAIDFDAVSVRVSGAPIRLTKREFELLRFLVENRNRVLSRDRLLERVGARPAGGDPLGRCARRAASRKAGMPAARSKPSSAWVIDSSKSRTDSKTQAWADR